MYDVHAFWVDLEFVVVVVGEDFGALVGGDLLSQFPDVVLEYFWSARWWLWFL